MPWPFLFLPLRQFLTPLRFGDLDELTALTLNRTKPLICPKAVLLSRDCKMPCLGRLGRT